MVSLLGIYSENLTLLECTIFSFSAVFLALFGILINRRNLIILFLCVEIIFLCVSLNFLLIAHFLHIQLGMLYGIITIVLAAAESVVGISLLVVLFRLSGRLSFGSLTTLRG